MSPEGHTQLYEVEMKFPVADVAAMEQLAGRIVAEGLSVRDVEEIVALGATQSKQRRSRSTRQTPIEYQAVAERLSEQLETRVVVSSGAKRGRIVIEFGDVEDLARIVDALQTAPDPTAAPGPPSPATF